MTLGRVFALAYLCATCLVLGRPAFGAVWTVSVHVRETAPVLGPEAGPDPAWVRVDFGPAPSGHGFVRPAVVDTLGATADPTGLFPRGNVATSAAAAPDNPDDPNYEAEVLIRIALLSRGTGTRGASWDLHPEVGRRDVELIFRPRSQTVLIAGADDEFRASGGIELTGAGEDGSGGRAARIAFDVSASALGDLAGDTDQDGLLDCWELGGLGTLDLPSLGANPYRKDLFVEID